MKTYGQCVKSEMRKTKRFHNDKNIWQGVPPEKSYYTKKCPDIMYKFSYTADLRCFLKGIQEKKIFCLCLFVCLS